MIILMNVTNVFVMSTLLCIIEVSSRVNQCHVEIVKVWYCENLSKRINNLYIFNFSLEFLIG
jgi:hypothetical protein